MTWYELVMLYDARLVAQGLALSLALAACSSGGDSDGKGGAPNASGSGGVQNGGSGSGGGSSGSGGSQSPSGGGGASNSGGPATVIPIARTLEETTGDIAPLDIPHAEAYCGDPNNPASLKPLGTVVRTAQSQRYFVCIGDLGERSVALILTNEPGDAVQGFVPYAALFTWEDAARPNLERPSKGALNYALLVIDLLGAEANSYCSSSNDVFTGFRIGGATSGLCTGAPTPYRDEGSTKYVDVTFPHAAKQSFVLEPVPFVPPT